MNHCLFKAKDTKGAVGNTVDYSSLTFQWPRNASEARLLTRQEFRWLMEGLAIDQPKAIRPSKEKKDF